jgi:hypothetical protein
MVGCDGDIINCTVVKNTGSEYGGGIIWCQGTITNCLVWGNDHPQVATPDKSIVTYCCIQDWRHGGVGNITTDPGFVNESKHDYRLRLGSGCVDGGTNEPPGGLAEVDIDGNIRPIDGDYDGVAVADMGVYEQTELVEIEISGLEWVEENWSTKYKLIGWHEGGSSGETAGGVVNWWVEPGTYASIDDANGLLQTEEVDSRQDVTVYAEYIMNEMRMEAEMTVSILPICPAGGALQLDGGDDYVEIAGFRGVTGVRSRTVSAWIKTTMTTIGEIISWGYQGHYVPLDKEDVGGHNWVLMVLGEGNLRLGVGGGGINGTAIVADGQWHHVAAVLESDDGTADLSDVKLYVDGIEESTTSRTQRINTVGDADVRIGVFTIEGLWPQPWREHPGIIWPPGDSGRYFEGAIDEVRIWNVARSKEEIRANMHRRLEGNEAGLVGYWNFDEGQGQIVYDLSAKGNEGYLRHGPVWVDSDAPIGFCNIEAEVHIVPRVINRGGRWNGIFAIMRLPESIAKSDVSDEPFELYADLEMVSIEAIWQRIIGGPNGARVFALFDKGEFMDIVTGIGRRELTVVGRLESGQYIYGSDTVRIIKPQRRRRRRRKR